ncbi:kinase-like domain-containing protein [Hyaloraphidium curvatum]|nr:kinase-like domain-containing protein [Hyaloraphidium curvatum]
MRGQSRVVETSFSPPVQGVSVPGTIHGTEPSPTFVTVTMADDSAGGGRDSLRPDAPQTPPPPGHGARAAREASPVRPRPHDFELFFDKDFVFERDPDTHRRRKLGEGAFGVAYKAVLRRVTPAVVKVLKEGPRTDRRTLATALVKEVENWQRLADDNVLRFLGYCIEPLALVSEFADGGDLEHVLKDLKESGRPNTFPMPGFKKCLLQVAQAMRYLHSMDILHCDLKPANIMIRGGIYKVADFGFSTLRDLAGTSTAGTPAYLPPEALQTQAGTRSKAADVYSFGVIAYEVACGQLPNMDRVRSIAEGSPLSRPYEIANDDQAWHLMSICTDVDPFDRPLFEGAHGVVDLLERDIVQTEPQLPLPRQPGLLSKLRVNATDVSYSQEDRIGDGAFGTIFRGKLRGVTVVAVKVLPKLEVQEPRLLKTFRDEIAVWEGLTQRNVMPLLAFCESPPMTITEFCPQGNMRERLEAAGWDLALGLRFLKGVADGMAYLHSCGVLHGDLKCVNILIDDDVPKIADFGLAQLHPETTISADEYEDDDADSQSSRVTGGTVPFMAPERLAGNPLRAPGDVYSFAMVCYEVTSGGEYPFRGMGQFHSAFLVRSGRRPPRPYRIAADPLWALIQRAWAQEPADRPTFVEIAAELAGLLASGGIGGEEPEYSDLLSDDGNVGDETDGASDATV